MNIPALSNRQSLFLFGNARALLASALSPFAGLYIGASFAGFLSDILCEFVRWT